MTDLIHDLYWHEAEAGHLIFEDDPDYRRALEQFSLRYDQVYQTGDHKICEALWDCCFALAHFSSQVSFSHGMRLGIGLMWWGGTGLSGR